METRREGKILQHSVKEGFHPGHPGWNPFFIFLYSIPRIIIVKKTYSNRTGHFLSHIPDKKKNILEPF